MNLVQLMQRIRLGEDSTLELLLFTCSTASNAFAEFLLFAVMQ